MSRKSIFEVLINHWDLRNEMNRIQELIKCDIVRVRNDATYKLYEYCDTFCFAKWKQRRRCINCSDLANTLGIPQILNSPLTVDAMIFVLEFYINLVKLADYYKQYRSDHNNYKEFNLLYENMIDIIDHFNYELFYDENEERAIIVEKDAATTAVAEIVEPELAMQVIEYNHYTMKGDLARKKRVLLALGEKLEPMRKDIPSPLAEDVFFILNNLNIRHNNVDKGSKYKEHTANMTPKDLETWYDEFYQAALLAFLSVDHKERAVKIADLKSHY